MVHSIYIFCPTYRVELWNIFRYCMRDWLDKRNVNDLFVQLLPNEMLAYYFLMVLFPLLEWLPYTVHNIGLLDLNPKCVLSSFKLCFRDPFCFLVVQSNRTRTILEFIQKKTKHIETKIKFSFLRMKYLISLEESLLGKVFILKNGLRIGAGVRWHSACYFSRCICNLKMNKCECE